ncbi:MAG: DUF4136 domain-containing protein [Gemmatimonadota bacterium]
MHGTRTSMIAGTALVLLAAACGGPTISSDSDSSIPVPQGATYAFIGGTQTTTTNNRATEAPDHNEFVHQRIQNAIQDQMKAKGFRATADSASAHFVVRYFLDLRIRNGYVTTDYSPYYGWGWGRRYGGVVVSQPVQFKEGGLLIDLVERATGKLAWRGTIEGEVPDHSPTQEEISKVVGEAMATLKPTPGA